MDAVHALSSIDRSSATSNDGLAQTSYLAAIHLPFILRMRMSSNPMTRHDLLVTTNATSPFAGIWDCMHRVLLILSPPSADMHWDLLE